MCHPTLSVGGGGEEMTDCSRSTTFPKPQCVNEMAFVSFNTAFDELAIKCIALNTNILPQIGHIPQPQADIEQDIFSNFALQS